MYTYPEGENYTIIYNWGMDENIYNKIKGDELCPHCPTLNFHYLYQRRLIGRALVYEEADWFIILSV